MSQVRRIQLRRGTQADWSMVNPVLADGEVGVESDTNRAKLGDGTTAWEDLTYGFVTEQAAEEAMHYAEEARIAAANTSAVTGTVDTPDDLDPLGGRGIIMDGTGHGWVWTGSEWRPVGRIVGPPAADAGLLADRPDAGDVPNGFAYFAPDDLGGTTSTAVDGDWVRQSSSAENTAVTPTGELLDPTVQGALETLTARTGALSALDRLRSQVELIEDFRGPVEADGPEGFSVGGGWRVDLSDAGVGTVDLSAAVRGIIMPTLSGGGSAGDAMTVTREGPLHPLTAPFVIEWAVAIPPTADSRFTVAMGAEVQGVPGSLIGFRYDGGTTSQVQTVIQAGPLDDVETHARQVWSPVAGPVFNRFRIEADPLGGSVTYRLNEEVLAVHTTLTSGPLFLFPVLIFARHPDATGFAERVAQIDYCAEIYEVAR